ncbi:zinc finger protein 154-like [Leptopilina boulardi]|uniref:zinc finger protein 154-like n=1 Tax=Leptopilina boulardi TaxID=63433 RepID=UPI0021F59073|nr:zinc finger protein 154-like [Leptopilina boulardi]
MGFYQKQSLIRSKQIFTNNFACSTSSSSFIESESYAFKKYLCTDCGKSFSLKTSLKRHKEIYLNDEFSYIDMSALNNWQSTSIVGRNGATELFNSSDFNCSTCGKVYRNKKNLMRHVDLSKKKCINDFDVEFPALSISGIKRIPLFCSTLSSDVWKNCKTNLLCLKCGKRYKHNTCISCTKSYKWKKSLHRHVRESPECWPILLTSGNNALFQYPHNGSTYPCETCGRQYRRIISLQRHKKFECGVAAQFECVVCHSRFKHKHSLQRHYKVHVALQEEINTIAELKSFNPITSRPNWT